MKGTRLTIAQRKDMQEYINLGFTAEEISEATGASKSTVYKYKSVYAEKLAKEVNAIKKAEARVKDMKAGGTSLGEHPPTSVSIDYADYLRVVELCEKFNVQRHVGLRCLLHPQEMIRLETKLDLEDRVLFLERRLEEEEARNSILLEQLK